MTTGEDIFQDTNPIERKAAKHFYILLLDILNEWNLKYGVDKKGKVTKFQEGYLKVYDVIDSSLMDGMI